MSYASTILAAGPLAYYRLDETSGTVAHDSSGNGYNATLSSGVTLGQPGAIIGDSDTSMTFTTTAKLSLPNTLNYTTFSALTVEYWIKVAGLWQYVVVTCDDVTTVVYLDVVTSALSAGTAIEVSSIFDFVGTPQSNGFDELAIYDKVLSPLTILSHYTVAGYENPWVVFPALTRRDGRLSTFTRRNGQFSPFVRRDGHFPAGKRRDGSIPHTSRRDGQVPATKRRG